MTSLSHIGKDGNPSMVDVGDKSITDRTAKALAKIIVPQEILDELHEGEIRVKKGPVFQTAIIAGIQGAKKTSDLIPLCHPLGLHKVGIEIFVNKNQEIIVECIAKVSGKTGVEMEALTGASIAALTIYDMCKAMSHDIKIVQIQLMNKTGGKKDFEREDT